MDSDDTIDKDFYEKLCAEADRTSADIVKGDLKEISPDGKVILYPVNEMISKYKNKVCFYLSFTSAIYRRALVIKHQCFFNHRLSHTEDLVWLNRMAIYANTVVIVPGTYYHYQRHPDSADSRTLSAAKINSVLVGYKHIFLNVCHFAQTSPLDFSACYQFCFDAIFSFIFRTAGIKERRKCCQLLLFFYRHCTDPDFYPRYCRNAYPFLLNFLEKQDLENFADCVANITSASQITFNFLRKKIKQKKG